MFIPIFQPPGDESTNRGRAVKVLIVALLMALGAGLFLIALRGNVSAWSMILAAVALAALILGTIAYAYAAQRAEKDKRKRGLDGQDMYTLIDRLVDDLDDDERAYLQKRLDESHTAKSDELAESVESLLEQRSHNRLS